MIQKSLQVPYLMLDIRAGREHLDHTQEHLALTMGRGGLRRSYGVNKEYGKSRETTIGMKHNNNDGNTTMLL